MSTIVYGLDLAGGTGSESGCRLIGPGRHYIDVGAQSGDLIRTGEARSLRIAFVPLIRFGHEDGPASLPVYLTAPYPNFPVFFGLAKHTNAICTHSASGLTSDPVLGVAAECYTAERRLSGHDWAADVGYPTAFSVGHLGLGDPTSFGIACPTAPGVTVASSSSAGSSMRWGLVVDRNLPVAALRVAPWMMEIVVVDDYTITIAISCSVRDGGFFQGSFEAAKAWMLSLVQNRLPGANGSNGHASATLTFANGDARSYLASLPYFMVQWPFATAPLWGAHLVVDVAA